MGDIGIRRVREYVGGPPAPPETAVFLVDRLWPRGIARSRLDDLDVAWVKDVAPSNELRKWFGHDRERWAGFRTRYLAELKGNKVAAAPILAAGGSGDVLLLFDAKDEEHNQAVVLAEWLRRVLV